MGVPEGTYRCRVCSTRATVAVHPDWTECPEWVWVDGPGPWVDELGRRRDAGESAYVDAMRGEQ